MENIALWALVIAWGLDQAWLLTMAIRDTIQCKRLTYETFMVYLSPVLSALFAAHVLFKFVLR